MHPLLQRFLIGWVAGVVTTGALVSSAKRPHKLKRKKRKKQPDGTDEPVQIGAVALHDARLPLEGSLTLPEWRDRIVAAGSSVGSKVSSLLQREPRAAIDAEPSAPSSQRRTKRSSAHAKGRRGRKRKQATLWDSAKESLKQTVKETVADEVKHSPMGSAFQKLKDVSAKVKTGATTAATLVKKGIEGDPEPEDGSKPKPSLPQRLDAAGAALEKAVNSAAEGSAPDAREPTPKSVDASEVAAKVKQGIAAVGTWLQGPGAPGYKKSARPADGGEVVDAKDAPASKLPTKAAHDAPADARPIDDAGDSAGDDGDQGRAQR